MLTQNIDLNDLKKRITRKTKAIICVHLGGLPCDMKNIKKIAKKGNLKIIEDCSQAHGASINNKQVGSFGDVSTWSFCTDKIISTLGEGGMISTNNKKLWLKMWSLKDHGKNYKSVFYKKHKNGFKWLHDDLGSNYRMTEMQAAIGKVQLRSLDKQIKKRNVIANLYLNGLKDFYLSYDILKKPELNCQTCPLKRDKKKCNKCVHAYYRLNLFINKNKIDQIKLIEKLKKKNINCGVGSCPEIYREKIFKKSKIHLKKRLGNAKLLGETSIVFPVNPYKSLVKIKKEIFNIKKIINEFI